MKAVWILSSEFICQQFSITLSVSEVPHPSVDSVAHFPANYSPQVFLLLIYFHWYNISPYIHVTDILIINHQKRDILDFRFTEIDRN